MVQYDDLHAHSEGRHDGKSDARIVRHYCFKLTCGRDFRCKKVLQASCKKVLFFVEHGPQQTMAARGACAVLSVLCLGVVFASAQSNSSNSTTVFPDQHWMDTDGKRIEAHAAGMLQSAADSRWYWFGESKKLDDSKDPHKYDTQGVNCYSSETIAGPWKNEGQVLKQSDISVPGAHGPWIVQRPKVIFNNKTSKFVMYFHLDQPKHSLGVGVGATVG